MRLPAFIICITALIAPNIATAQSLSGVVVDRVSKLPLVNAGLSSKYGLAFTSATGWFVLSKAYPGDTLYITYVGYQPARLKLGSKRITDTIFLEKAAMLQEVAVHAHVILSSIPLQPAKNLHGCLLIRLRV